MPKSVLSGNALRESIESQSSDLPSLIKVLTAHVL